MMRSLLLVASLAAACALVARFTGSFSHGFDGSVVVHHVPRTTLMSDTGAPIVLGPSRSGAIVVLGYTQCTDACPLTLAKVAAALSALSSHERREAFFVTVDPRRDDPPTLRRYLRAWNNRIVGVTGSGPALNGLWVALGAGDPGSRYRDHDTRIFVINAEGDVERELFPGASVSEIRRSLLGLALDKAG